METTTPALNPPPTLKKRVRWQFYLAGLLTFTFLIYFFQPGISTWWLRRQLTARAREMGSTVTFAKVEADFFSGHALLNGMELTDERHSENQIRSADIEIDFSPWRLLFGKDLSPIKKIAVGKTQVDWKWQSEKAEKHASARLASNFHNRFPESFTGNSISANLACGNTKIDLANADFTFLPNVAGEIDIPHLTASLPPWKRTFSNLEGTTAIKDRALYVGGIKFTPDLVLERGSLDFTKPEKQKITSDLLFSAFGGQWRTDLDLDRRKSPVEIDTAASFWNLSVRELGEFVGNNQLAEGTIHEGRLTFHGSPGEMAKSNTTLRLNATDFRWHERRWNSLIASGLLVNRRIEIAQFDLVQDKNQIQLKGTSNLPAKWTQLPNEFQFQVLAQIDDLHSAALLLLPGQKGIAGEAFFAGEVRNQGGQFSGNLKMRGGPLEISGVAVDRVRGDLNLQGSEVSATALEFARQGDKAAGWGTLNLAEPRRYTGEFSVTAADIADYDAILPKAVAEHAAAGGVKLWWSGDGTSHAHSGAFKVSLRDFLVSHEANAVPLGVESHGSYSPAGITLNQLSLVRPNAKLSAALIVRPESMELRDLHLNGSGGATATGNITLPINLLAALNNPTLASLLDSKASATGQITASKVRLDELCELAGRHLPVRGRTNFSLAAEGPLDSLEGHIQMELSDFFGPENLTIPAMKATVNLTSNALQVDTEINPGEVRDTISAHFAGKTALSQENLIKGQWLDDSAALSGTIEANRLALPLLHPWWRASRVLKGDAGAHLTLTGTWKTPAFDGAITLQNTEWQPEWLESPLQKLNGALALTINRLSWEKITGSYRGGSFTVNGTSGFLPAENVDLTIEGKALTLSAADDSHAVADGTVHLQGPAEGRSISGAVRLQSTVLHRELTLSAPEVELPPVSRFSLPWVPADWKIELEVTAAQPVEIRGKENTWLVQPELVLRDTARTPLILGKLRIQPMALTRNATAENDAVLVYFMNSTLENGTVESAKPTVTADLPPAPAVESATATPSPTPAPAPLRLEIAPLAP
ncbi:MAG: hypothetical protein ABIT76_00990 [Chthoniobacterales bacterium]